VASRKEQKEALRRERQERERAALDAERRRRRLGYGAGGALAGVAVAVVVVLLLTGGGGGGSGGGTKGSNLLPSGGTVPTQRISDLKKAASAGGCVLRSQKATSRAHITDIHQKVHYSSNPPTSGRHYYVPASDGAYSTAPPDVAAVHALEHGRIDIWFKPRLDRTKRADLKALFDEEKGYQLLLMPRANMPFQMAATAWGRDPVPDGTGYLLGCASFRDSDFDALRAFIDAHRGQGPEPVP
jgi:Protein of unknown function (DUF3105)